MKDLPSIQISRITSSEDCAPEYGSESFLQSKFWGLFKSRTGWQAYSCSYCFEGKSISGHLIVLRRKFARFFTFLYVPFGAEELEPLPERWATLAALGRAVGRSLGGTDIFIRFDIPWMRPLELCDAETDSPRESEIKKFGLHKGMDVQVPDTVVLDITKGEEELLAGMKPKWRYNIRLSQKKGVFVEDEGMEGLPTFMSLYRETARRDKIAIHPLSYYTTLFETAAEVSSSVEKEELSEASKPYLSLYVARHESDALAGIIVLHMRESATYLYGASSDKKRNLMPAYALQWHAITEAKKRGIKTYDFWGIPPEKHDAFHPMAGLFLFKTGFGGDIFHRYGAYDLGFRPFIYRAFRAGEQLRLLWHKKIRKNIGKLYRTMFKKRVFPQNSNYAEKSSSENQDSEKTNPSNP
jgi:lipid II:glycine glycyltransferase (peptidoglycan interpeptide bridge formation enzyme)